MLGFSEERVWNSFFLQYLWEFCLGMKLAEAYSRNPSALDIPKWKHIIPLCIVCLALTGIMGSKGFPWKLYNDIPSLVGYTTLALIVYKSGINVINRFFSHTNRFSYEWYLVHILVFQIISSLFGGKVNTIIEIIVCLLLSYLSAIGYARCFAIKK